MKRGELTGRADVNYWRLYPLYSERLNKSCHKITRLSDIVVEEPAYGSGARAIERQSPNQPRYIRITDFGDDGIEPGHEYLTVDRQESDCKLLLDDVLFARSGATVGKSYLHEDASEPAIFAGYCIRFRFDKEQSLPHFVYHFTKSCIYKLWVEMTQRPSGQPNINKEEFKTCELPLPPLPMQRELVMAMETARGKRRAKLAEADTLLASLDGYLLKNLALTPPPPDARRVFAIRLGTVRESRFDPDYFHPERILTVRGMEKVTGRLWCPSLHEAVTFQRDQIAEPGENYLSLAHVQRHTGELVAANEEAAGTCFTFQRDDVLFGRLRPYLNKVHRAERPGCCSPEFHVLRVKPDTTLLPEYLATILRSSLILAQTRHMMTGNTHPRLANDDVVNLIIPVPDIATQTTIAAEVRRRREEARRLRVEAEAGWQKAKLWFETQLLGAK